MEQAIDWRRHQVEQLLEYIDREELINYIIELEEYRIKSERIENKLRIDSEETLKGIRAITDEEESIPIRKVGLIMYGYIIGCIEEMEEVNKWLMK